MLKNSVKQYQKDGNKRADEKLVDVHVMNIRPMKHGILSSSSQRYENLLIQELKSRMSSNHNSTDNKMREISQSSR